MGVHCRFALVIALLLSGFPARAQQRPPASDLNIAETVWGFDGKVTLQTFSLLSVLVQNTGPSMASGTLRVERMVPVGQAAGPALTMDFDVPPFEERWVQLAPFISEEYVPWRLSWGPGEKQTAELPLARSGEPAAVLLANPNDRPLPSGALKRFKTNLFPASVTHTDGLDAVFLDVVPDFQGARLQSFLEWLQKGGRVFLLHSDDHQPVRFPNALSMFNDPQDAFPVGSGWVRRVPTRARDLSDRRLQQLLAADRVGAPSTQTTVAFSDPLRTYNGRLYWDGHRKVLEKLEGVTRFDRRWWLIYPLALLYLLAIFPGSYLAAQSQSGVRWFYAMYFATALLFSWAFTVLGGVGGGAASRIRSATVARQLAPGIFDCTQWNCLAAVSGGWYALEHEASGRLYAANEEYETPHGQIALGAKSRFEIDIPVASTRSLVARFRKNAPAFTTNIQSIDFIDRKITACRLAFDGLPAEPLEAYVCHRDLLLKLAKNGDGWANDRRSVTSTAVFVGELDRVPSYSLSPRSSSADMLLNDEFYRSLDRGLVGNAFQIREYADPKSATLPAGILRVMALVPSDKGFGGTADGFTDVQGCVLYVQDISVTDN